MAGKSRAGTRRLRLDELLVRRGLAPDLKQAAALILRGAVLVENQRIHQAGTQVKADAGLRVKETASRYVSRAGGKLAAALGTFQVSARGRICWDLGASTGGFTDCLLQEGAARVYAVDVGRGQLHWNLQKDERVIRRDGINVRYLDPEEIGEKPDLITVDLSFISLRLVLPGLNRLSPVTVVALVKPQFEARRSEVEAGGLITDDALRTRVIERLRDDLSELGVEVLADTPSSVAGKKGNREHFFLCRV
jgi:23S rRNA (cytidine1920-2'-O)/16S rRNA (cytidine1409-2'-O)-methyltransferase